MSGNIHTQLDTHRPRIKGSYSFTADNDNYGGAICWELFTPDTPTMDEDQLLPLRTADRLLHMYARAASTLPVYSNDDDHLEIGSRTYKLSFTTPDGILAVLRLHFEGLRPRRDLDPYTDLRWLMEPNVGLGAFHSDDNGS